MTRLQGSLNAAARALAPSKEAPDTPLSPPPPDDKPGPATGRSGAYPNRTLTCKPGPAFRTQHGSHHMPILEYVNAPSPGHIIWRAGSRACPFLSYPVHLTSLRSPCD